MFFPHLFSSLSVENKPSLCSNEKKTPPFFVIIIPFPDFFMLFLGNRSVLFKAALAGESRQPHLTLAMGVGGC